MQNSYQKHPLYLALICFIFLIILFQMALSKMIVVDLNYKEINCSLLDKRIEEKTSSLGTLTFRPNFLVQYTVDGETYEKWVYDAVHTYSKRRINAEIIVNRFNINSTYSCWYDPLNPENIVLEKTMWWVYPVFLLLLIVGIISLFQAIHKNTKSKSRFDSFNYKD